MTANVPPEVSSRVVDPNGRIDPVWNKFFREIWRLGKTLTETTGTLSSGKAAASQAWSSGVLIEVPTDKAYNFPRVGHDGTIDEITVVTTTGTCTVTISIDGNPLIDGALAASTTQTTETYTQGNELSAEQDITITVSSASAPENLSVTLRGTRTFAT